MVTPAMNRKKLLSQVYQTVEHTFTHCVGILLLGLLLLLPMQSAYAQTKVYRAPQTTSASFATAIFAGGCFWCMEPPFDALAGVLRTWSGFTDGHTPNPSYKQVSAGGTGHTEAILVEYDPSRIEYETLLKTYWRNVDPTAKDRQFCDMGTQYRAGIYPQGDEQMQLAQRSRQMLQDTGRFKRIEVEIKKASAFYLAEEYHQDYAQKNPWRYKYYRSRCGRDKRLTEIWGSQ